MAKSDSQSPGLEPSAGTSAAPFWTAASKQPLQQHRFLVNFPIYEPLQIIIATASAKYYPEFASLSASERLREVSKKLFALGAYKTSFQEGRSRISNNNRSNEIVKLSVTQFAALSFQPPSFGFVPGVADYQDGKGAPVIDPSKYQYSRGDATLTLITSLQENLHFSLNFLFNVAKSTRRLTKEQREAKDTQLVSGGIYNAHNAVLYPNTVVDLNMQERVLVIKELSAQGRPIGLHLLHDPAIKSVDFGEFNYGGTELLKVTLTLTYSANPDRGPLGYYSYQALTRAPEPAPVPPRQPPPTPPAASAPTTTEQPEGSVSSEPTNIPPG